LEGLHQELEGLHQEWEDLLVAAHLLAAHLVAAHQAHQQYLLPSLNQQSIHFLLYSTPSPQT